MTKCLGQYHILIERRRSHRLSLTTKTCHQLSERGPMTLQGNVERKKMGQRREADSLAMRGIIDVVEAVESGGPEGHECGQSTYHHESKFPQNPKTAGI